MLREKYSSALANKGHESHCFSPSDMPTDSSMCRANSFSRVSHNKEIAVDNHPHIYTGVTALLGRETPRAIFRAVTQVVVKAVNRVFPLRPTSHVRKEISKAVSPPITNSYPPSSPVFEPFVIRVVAPRNHVFPSPVLYGSSHAMSNPAAVKMLSATTSRSASTFQVIKEIFFDFPTIALSYNFSVVARSSFLRGFGNNEHSVSRPNHNSFGKFLAKSFSSVYRCIIRFHGFIMLLVRMPAMFHRHAGIRIHNGNQAFLQ